MSEYALGAIVYRESLGYDEEVASNESSIAEELARRGVRVQSKFPYFGGEIPSIGIGQLRPNTALELENAGFVHKPISDNGEWIFIEPNSFEAPKESLLCPHCQRVNRLLDPVWAIEYVAANMEYARTRPGYNDPQWPGKELIDEWHKMAGWYNRGVVNLSTIDDPVQRDNIWADLDKSYLPGTWGVMQVMEKFDLLGVSSTCNNDCGQTPREMIFTPR